MNDGTRRERIVSAFDFDGTLSSRDNVIPFLCVVAGKAEVGRALVAAAPAMLAARRDRSQRDVAKAIVVRRTLAGRHEDHVRDLGERFARLIVAEHLHTDVAARLDAHRAAGHAVVLVSASLAVYLDAVAALLGVEHVLATELEVGRDGRLTGELLGANVRGAEKARRLDEWLGDTAATVYAYGDGHGDSELLARADHAVMIDGRGRIPAPARI